MRLSALNLIFILVLVSSCTIQKRLYQPGWDISFKGNWKKDLALKSNHEVREVAEQDSLEKQVLIEKNKVLPSHELIAREENQVESAFPTITEKTEQAFVHVSKQLELVQSTFASKIVVPKTKNEPYNPSREINLVGLIVLVIGLVVIAVGLMIYLPAISSTTAFMSGIVGILLLGLGGIISLVGLIIMLAGIITNAIIKNEERISKEKADKEAQSETGTENPQQLEPIPYVPEPEKEKKQTKKPKAWLIIGGFIAAFGIIFLLISPK
jgi:uncharacterized membrane protein